MALSSPMSPPISRTSGQSDRLTYKWKRRPYHHQVKAVKKLLSTGFGGALLMEPRTGKTKVAIDYVSILHAQGKIDRVLVFCPVGVMGVWKDEIEANCPYPHRVMVWDRKARKKDTPLPPVGKGVLEFVIVNYDALAVPGAYRRDRKTGEYITDSGGNKLRSKTRGGRYEVKDKLLRWQPQAVLMDESHRVKSPSAKKTTALMSMAPNFEYRVIMTGTVVTKSKRLFDVYAQWKILNPGRFAGLNFGEFKAKYGQWKAITTGTGGQFSKYLGPQNEDDLHQKIHVDSFSITRDECYDLPKQTVQIIPVELDESAPVYDQMAEDMVARIQSGEITEASIPLVQRLRLQQITSGIATTAPTPDYPKGRLAIIGSEKLEVWRDRLEDLMDADEKVVVGALFKSDIQRLQEAARKLKVPVFVVAGGIKVADREYARKEFQRVSGGAVFIGQPAAAGEGIDLSAASILQWFSLPSSWVHFRQFSDRIALSDRPTFHEFFLARGTIDYLIKETLDEDGDVGKKMITSPERLLRLQEAG